MKPMIWMYTVQGKQFVGLSHANLTIQHSALTHSTIKDHELPSLSHVKERKETT